MSSNLVQENKQIVWDFWQKLNEGKVSDLTETLHSYVHEDISWHGPHPINDLNGVDALLSGFWQPLLYAIPDLQRTCEIFIGGHEHWVGAIGYFSGTFTNDWLGIPATGREVQIRFGELSAVYGSKIGLTYIIPDVLDVIRQAGYQVVAPSHGIEGIVSGPMTGDGVLLPAQNDEDDSWTLELAKIMCRKSTDPTHWDADRMRWYGPSGIGTCRGMEEYRANHARPFGHAFPRYGRIYGGKHVAEVSEGNYAGWVGWPSIVTYHTGEYLGIPPSGRLAEWRLMDFYRREGDLIIENWIPVDMVHLALTMGVDVFARLQEQIRQGGSPA